ncbi:hypothetical protein SLS60_001735 [Paraconiothyrium brasiliense]|uniref:AB hydrolase-1 domain-containing protein n=1 Tax=Paraconiothyrium brasiliense TaxID=300254 RepID=A0ABR3S078_9PLEO
MSEITAILVHGGGQGPWAYDRVKSKLEARGTFGQVMVPKLATSGSTKHTMSDDIAVVEQSLEAALATSYAVVLVGHSIGATIAAAALQKLLPEDIQKVKSLIMIAGVIIPPGMSVAEFGAPPPYLEVNENTRNFKRELLATLMYNDMGKTDPELESYMAKNDFSSQGLYAEKCPWSPYNAEQAALPLVYIMTAQDQVCAMPYQHMFVAGMPKEQTTVVELDAGHMVTLTDPDRITDEIVRVTK